MIQIKLRSTDSNPRTFDHEGKETKCNRDCWNSGFFTVDRGQIEESEGIWVGQLQQCSLYSLCSSRSKGTVDVWRKDSWILAYVHVPCSWTLSFRTICCYIFLLRQPGSTLNVPLNTSGLATRYRYAASQRICSFLLIWIYRFYWNGDEPSTSNFSVCKYISRLEFLSSKNTKLDVYQNIIFVICIAKLLQIWNLFNTFFQRSTCIILHKSK